MCLRCGHAAYEAQLERHKDRCTAFQKQIWKNTERGGKGGERAADWRIGAQSEAVKKGVHLNAPLHPNNSSTAKKKIKRHSHCYSLLCPSLCFWAAVQDIHLSTMYQENTSLSSVCCRDPVVFCFSRFSSHFRIVHVAVSQVNNKYLYPFLNLLYKVSQGHLLYFIMYHQWQKKIRKTWKEVIWHHQITSHRFSPFLMISAFVSNCTVFLWFINGHILLSDHDWCPPAFTDENEQPTQKQ